MQLHLLAATLCSVSGLLYLAVAAPLPQSPKPNADGQSAGADSGRGIVFRELAEDVATAAAGFGGAYLVFRPRLRAGDAAQRKVRAQDARIQQLRGTLGGLGFREMMVVSDLALQQAIMTDPEVSQCIQTELGINDSAEPVSSALCLV
jgi:hypothetical protein